MEVLDNLALGFSVALSAENLLFAFLGCLVGTLVGVLPGVGGAAAVAILIPITFQLDPIPAIIMLCAIRYGTEYGGTITSVLLNVPGESASAVTCLDGYPMAKQGRAGVALSMAAIGSFVGGTLAILGMALAAPPLARLALNFGPSETFALMVLGLTLLMGLAGKSVLKALLMGLFGLALAMVGLDPAMGFPRFTFGRPELFEGVGFVPVTMGLFGIGEVLLNAESSMRQTLTGKVTGLVPSAQDIRASALPIARGSIIGFFIGIIPGMGATISSFVSYVAEKRSSRHPERFGTGMIEGVAGPETANNAHANASLIPLFALGIPASATIAVIFGAFLMNGLTPGPFLFRDHPDVAWGVIASMFIGNVMLLILNLPLIPLWVKVLQVPYSILFGFVLAFMAVGAYSLNNSPFQVLSMLLFGVIGYLLRKLDYPLAPVILTLILGTLLEKNMRRALEISQGDFSIFYDNSISLSLLVLAAAVLMWPVVGWLIRASRRAGREGAA